MKEKKTMGRLATTGKIVAGAIAVGVIAKAAVSIASAALALAFWGAVGTSLACYLGRAGSGKSRGQ